jgi:hypothetical protein
MGIFCRSLVFTEENGLVVLDWIRSRLDALGRRRDDDTERVERLARRPRLAELETK